MRIVPLYLLLVLAASCSNPYDVQESQISLPESCSTTVLLQSRSQLHPARTKQEPQALTPSNVVSDSKMTVQAAPKLEAERWPHPYAMVGLAIGAAGILVVLVTCSRAEQRSSSDRVSALMKSLPLAKQHKIMLACAFLGFMTLGNITDPIGTVFPQLQLEWGPLSTDNLAMTSSACTLGQVLSCLIAGSLIDRFGRCCVVACSTLLTGACAVWCITAYSFSSFVAARFCGGMVSASHYVTFPTILAECIPRRSQHLLVVYQCGYPVGAFIFAATASLFNSWRLAVATNLIICCCLVPLLLFPGGMVESPIFLLTKNCCREAGKSLRVLGASREQVERSMGCISAESQPQQTNEKAEIVANQDTTIKLLPLYILALGFVVCQGTASQLVKLWLPTVAILRGLSTGPAGNQALAMMWLIECCGIIASGLAVSSISARDGNKDLQSILKMGQAAFFVAASSAIATLAAPSMMILSIVGGVHLTAQACAMNMVFPFLPPYFPAAHRGKLVAGLLMASYGGTFIGPLLGSMWLTWLPTNQAPFALLVTASSFYLIGMASVRGIESMIKESSPCLLNQDDKVGRQDESY